eukprot:63023-Pleurochrysis_carterae.AAC.1
MIEGVVEGEAGRSKLSSNWAAPRHCNHAHGQAERLSQAKLVASESRHLRSKHALRAHGKLPATPLTHGAEEQRTAPRSLCPTRPIRPAWRTSGSGPQRRAPASASKWQSRGG